VAAGFAVSPISAADEAKGVPQELKRIVDAFMAISQESADPVPADVAFYQGAIPGMLRTLDPHSVFFGPEQFTRLQELQDSERKGFGTIVNLLPGRVMILQSIEGTPAARAGLAGGDEILAVNDIDVSYLEVERLSQLLEMSRQKEVTLQVLHAGERRPVEIKMSPQLIEEPTVDRAFKLTSGIGYVHVKAFESPTGKLVKAAVDKLGGEYLDGLILDLRGNPGGVVDAAIETASLFLAPDQLIFSTKGRKAMAQDVYVPTAARPYSFPVVVLMNGGSASASEIVAGALQDHDRALVMGEPSYGKGLVQQVMPLSGGTGMALTVAFYYTPSGRSIQKQLASGQLGAATKVSKGPYRSDAGRTLLGGGGIQPDELMYPDLMTPLQEVLDVSGSFLSFAGEYRRTHTVTGDATVTNAIMDEFRLFLVERRIQPGAAEWNEHREWIVSRLQQELLTLTFGVARGDEVELHRDPVVQLALRRLGGSK